MSEINLSGIGTGIDWTTVINAEIQSRRAQVISPIQNWRKEWTAKQNAFDELRTYLVSLESAAQDMDTPAELRSYAVNSSESTTIGASVTGTPTPGSYAVIVNQLAAAQSEIHAGVDDDATVLNNSGGTMYFAYSYGDTDVTLEVGNGITLQQLVDLINNDVSNPGVTASVLDDGTGSSTSHHLVLRGKETGADYTISVNAAVTTLQGDWGDLTVDASAGTSSITVDDPSPFAQYMAIIIDDDDSTAEYHIVESVAGSTLNLRDTLGDDFTVGQNAYATPRGIGSGLSTAEASGQTVLSVDDATSFQVGKTVIIADGSASEEATITAVDTTANTITLSAGLSNSYAADGYVTQLEGGRRFTFEDTDFTAMQAAQNAQLRIDGYPPSGWIERESNTVNDVIGGVTLTLSDDSDGSAVTIAVSEDHEAVKAKINALVAAYNVVKTFLNQQTDYDTETKAAGVLLGNYAAGLIEQRLGDIIITAPPGFKDGTDPFTLLGQIGIHTVARGAETDDSLGTLVVEDEELDDALAEDFEGVIQLFSSYYRGFTDSDYLTCYYVSDKYTTPGTYDVQADFDAGGNLIAGRFKLASESTYRGANLSVPYIYGQSGDPEDSLWVKAVWDGVSSTQSAVVRVQQGVAGRVGDLMDEVLDPTEGVLHNLNESYGDIIGQIDDRVEDEQNRLDLLRETLVARYSRLEQLMVEMQARQSWVSNLSSAIG